MNELILVAFDDLLTSPLSGASGESRYDKGKRLLELRTTLVENLDLGISWSSWGWRYSEVCENRFSCEICDFDGLVGPGSEAECEFSYSLLVPGTDANSVGR